MTTHPLDDAPLGAFHKRLALGASGGLFLDGYVLSIIGAALVQLDDQWHLSASEQGLIGASTLVGILIGALVGGSLIDRYGRRTLFRLDLIAVVACSVTLFFAPNVWWVIALRLLIGTAIGADYPTAGSMLSEFAPRKYRGPLFGFFVTMWFVGAATAYIVGEALSRTGESGWRWMLASAAVPATLVVLARLGMPESPRWLAGKRRFDEANVALQKVLGTGVSVADLNDEVHGKVDLRSLLRSGYGKRIAFVTIFWTCAIIPLFAMYAFAPSILGEMGFEGDVARLGSAVITLLLLVGCVIAAFLVNRMGRRPLLIHSFLWSGIALGLIGTFSGAPTFAVMGLFAAYALLIGGTQIMQQVYPNELFPTEIRGVAVGLASSLSRIGAAFGTFLVPWSLVSLGAATTMLIAAAITLAGATVSLRWAPETRGLTLAESAALGRHPTPRADVHAR
ncbi:MFS transporter [Aldersonia kunmingensis]|uniref:MFS transporter n=1 Tax=Aldersonia kunmingensis TaxID=408066 RepID=UPI00082ECABA|nr:MFS transporter [Aldersonia kunmingensis]